MSFYLYTINTGFVIDSSGYVGILTGNPKFPLEINGTCKANHFIGDLVSGRVISGQILNVQNFTTEVFTMSTFSGQSFSGQSFTGDSFTGKNFYGGNFSGKDAYLEHLFGINTGSYMSFTTFGDFTGTNGSIYVNGNDIAGEIQIIVDNPSTSAISLDVYFKKSYSNPPIVVFSPCGTMSATLSGVACKSTNGSFFKFAKSNATSLPDGVYQWNYIVIGRNN